MRVSSTISASRSFGRIPAVADASNDFPSPGGPANAAVADVNNDGDLDLVYSGRSVFTTVLVHLGNGDGTFETLAAADFVDEYVFEGLIRLLCDFIQGLAGPGSCRQQRG